MKLSAHRFAVAIWIGSALIALATFVENFPSGHVPIQELADTPIIEMILGFTAKIVLYAGPMAAFGAMVQLLGEIRDQVARRP